MAKKIKKVAVNRDLCIGAASCVAVMPAVFELDAESKAVLIQKNGLKNSGPANIDTFDVSNVDQETLRMAAESCPTKAIFLYDEDGNQIYPD
jgi:ferredoxin